MNKQEEVVYKYQGGNVEEEDEEFDEGDYEQKCMFQDRGGQKHCDANAKALFETAKKKNEQVIKLLARQADYDQLKAKVAQMGDVSADQIKDLQVQNQNLQNQLASKDNLLAEAQDKISVLEAKVADFDKAPKLQRGQFGADTIKELNQMNFDVCNVHFVQRARVMKNMHNFDQFGAAVEKAKNQESQNKNAIMSNEDLSQLLMDVFYPPIDFIEYDKKDEQYDVRTKDAVDKIQDQVFQGLLVLESIMKLLETSEDTKGKFHAQQVCVLGGLLKNMLNQLPVREAEPGHEGWNRNTMELKSQLGALAARIRSKGQQQQDLYQALGLNSQALSDNKAHVNIARSIGTYIKAHDKWVQEKANMSSSQAAKADFDDF